MAAQPRVPAGDKRRGRIHPGEFAPKPKPKPKPAAKGGQGRKGGGARGRAGAPVPKSAPKHTRKVVHATRPGSSKHNPEKHYPEEMVGGFKCKHCAWPGWREHRVVTGEGAHHATLAFAGCTNCGTLHPARVGIAEHANATNAKVHAKVKTRVRKMADLTVEQLDVLKTTGELVDAVEAIDVRKSMDSTETAVQADDGVTHRTGCPKGGNAPCGPEKGGRCTACGWQVQDHQAVGKTAGLNAVVLELRSLAGVH